MGIMTGCKTRCTVPIEVRVESDGLGRRVLVGEGQDGFCKSRSFF